MLFSHLGHFRELSQIPFHEAAALHRAFAGDDHEHVSFRESLSRLGKGNRSLPLSSNRHHLQAEPALWIRAKGAEAAYKLVRDELRRNPTLLGLDRLLEAQIVADAHPERRRDLELVRNLVHSHTRRLARYRCEECGFKARQFHWHCPACGSWESYPPRRTEEFDLTP